MKASAKGFSTASAKSLSMREDLLPLKKITTYKFLKGKC